MRLGKKKVDRKLSPFMLYSCIYLSKKKEANDKNRQIFGKEAVSGSSNRKLPKFWGVKLQKLKNICLYNI